MVRRGPIFRLAATLLALLATGSAQADAPVAESRVYVLNQDAGSISVLGERSRTVQATLTTDASPARLALSADGTTLYLTHPAGHQLSAVDAASGRTVARVTVQGEPFAIAIDPRDGAVLAADWNGGELLRLDPGLKAVTGRLALGGSPAAMVIVGGRMFVADRAGDAVAVVDLPSWRLVTRMAVGKAPFALVASSDGRHLYVANARSASVSVIDVPSLTATRTLAVGQMPYGVAMSPDDALLFVANQQSGSVSIIDAEQLVRLIDVKVGRYPEGICLGADGSTVYVTNWLSNDVSVLAVPLAREVGRIAVGGGPRAVAQDGHC